jgi:hypothetical protein
VPNAGQIRVLLRVASCCFSAKQDGPKAADRTRPREPPLLETGSLAAWYYSQLHLVHTEKIMKFYQSVALAVLVGLATPSYAQGPEAPCGRDVNGYPLQCARPDPGANLESACMTTGRVENCVPYHRNSCEVRGFQQACRLYNLGRNCFGGDQNTCNYYVSLLRANTACSLDRNQNACAYLQQQGF